MKPKAKFRKTKIVCTLGPATSSPEMIAKLIDEGMDVARLNFSHGSREQHRQTIRTIRALSRQTGKEIGILQDLAGPKIRLGQVHGGKRTLKHGERVTLVAGNNAEGCYSRELSRSDRGHRGGESDSPGRRHGSIDAGGEKRQERRLRGPGRGSYLFA